MSTATSDVPKDSLFRRICSTLMAICLGAMALSVFINVVLRYGFGSGVAASEELSRLLFVWMVFIGATAAYPAGEHMTFTSLVGLLRTKPRAMLAATLTIRLLVVASSGMIAWGAWKQVIVGLDSYSVVLRYPTALLPLPAFLCASVICVMACVELIKRTPLHMGFGAQQE